MTTSDGRPPGFGTQDDPEGLHTGGNAVVGVGRESGRSRFASGRAIDGRFWVGRHREKGLMVFDKLLARTPRGGVYLFHVSLGRVIGFRSEIIREPEHWSRPDEDEARRAVASYTTCAVRPSGAGSRFRKAACFSCRASVDSMVSEKCASCGWLTCAACGACGCSYGGFDAA